MAMVDAKGWTNAEWLNQLATPGPLAEGAQRALVEAIASGLRRSFSGRADVLEQVEDFAQEATVRVLARLAQFRGDSRFVTWALAIAIRVAYDELRRCRWRDVSLDELLAGGMPSPPERSEIESDRSVGRQQALALLEKSLRERLTEKQRLALTGEMKGMPQSELAERLGTNRNALYKLTHDARKELKAALQDAGLTAGAVFWAFEK